MFTDFWEVTDENTDHKFEEHRYIFNIFVQRANEVVQENFLSFKSLWLLGITSTFYF